MSDERFWNTVHRYCAELAPVVGPIFGAAADLAGALDRAGAANNTPARLPAAPEDD